MHDNAVFTRDDLNKNKTDNTNVVAIISILHVDGVYQWLGFQRYAKTLKSYSIASYYFLWLFENSYCYSLLLIAVGILKD